MERYQARTTDLPPVRQEPVSDHGECISALARRIVTINSGSSPSDRGAVKGPKKDSVDPDVFRTLDPLWDQVLAIRRRLWILSATLESLPTKIEQAYRKSSGVAGGAQPDHPWRSPSPSGHGWLSPDSEGFVGSWWAKRKLARLRSRADRAERRAAAAIREASESFGTALEAALQAAVARLKADEACLSFGRTLSSRRRDCGGD
jgi:hypothetical protein